jgi:hypothetical protein
VARCTVCSVSDRDQIGNFAGSALDSSEASEQRESPAIQMRTPTESESFWGRRLAAGAVLAAVLGVVVGGSASALFFIVAVLIGLGAARMFRGTMPPGTGGGDPGGTPLF